VVAVTPIPLGFEPGDVYRVRRDADLLRDRFRAGEVMVFWRHAYSIYDSMHGFFFLQAGSERTRAWDTETADAAERDGLLEKIGSAAPVIGAARTGDVEAVRQALPATRDVEGLLMVQLAIESAIAARQPGGIPLLLEWGQLPLPQREGLMRHAASSGVAGAVEAFLETGVAVDARDTYGQTALSQGACSGDVPTVRLLLARGATVGITTKSGSTPRSLAVARRLDAIVALLDEAAARQKG
jgi:hypothetical protein